MNNEQAIPFANLKCSLCQKTGWDKIFPCQERDQETCPYIQQGKIVFQIQDGDIHSPLLYSTNDQAWLAYNDNFIVTKLWITNQDTSLLCSSGTGTINIDPNIRDARSEFKVDDSRIAGQILFNLLAYMIGVGEIRLVHIKKVQRVERSFLGKKFGTTTTHDEFGLARPAHGDATQIPGVIESKILRRLPVYPIDPKILPDGISIEDVVRIIFDEKEWENPKDALINILAQDNKHYDRLNLNMGTELIDLLRKCIELGVFHSTLYHRHGHDYAR